MLKELIATKDVKVIAKHLFNINLAPMQEKIVRAIAFKESKRIVITAYTRYGKSYSVAIGVLLYILFNKNKRILLIAPKLEQTGILRNYIAGFIIACPLIADQLELNVAGAEYIKREVSRKRMTFRNGCELRVMSAEGTAERLMGFGGDLIINDEDCLIDAEVYRQKISRMLGDSPDSMLVSIGNPWHRDNQMYEHWCDPKFLKLHIGWQTGVREGRITKEYVEEQRELLTIIEFTILYEAEFPEESEDQLIRKEWVDNAIKRQMQIAAKKKVAGIDVAEFGLDWTVLIIGYTDGNNYKIETIQSWGKKDTMQTVGLCLPHIDKNMFISVDAIGVGSGVHARLKELGYKAEAIKVGSSPIDHVKKVRTEASRFLNQKAQRYWKLRELFEHGRLDIPENRKLIKELLAMKYEITSGGKIRIVDPEDKSPDYADSLMLCCGGVGGGLAFAFG